MVYWKTMDPLYLIISIPVLVYSAILHEIAHGLIADRLGDPTARLSGRLTLNPISHIDLYMTILLPILTAWSSQGHLIFGGAKPVPIDTFNLKDGKKDVALVSLAGPLTNLLLTGIAALLLHFLNFGPQNSFIVISLKYLFQVIAFINLYLAIFNFLPIPPLDGSKVFALLLPDDLSSAYLSLGTIGILILFVLLSFPIGGFYLPDFMQHLYTIVSTAMGL